MPNIDNGRYLDGLQDLDAEVGRHIFSVANEPVFYWQGPDAQTVLRRATTYDRHRILWISTSRIRRTSRTLNGSSFSFRAQEKTRWPFSDLLSQDGCGFMLVKKTIANRVRSCSSYVYPELSIRVVSDNDKLPAKLPADRFVRAIDVIRGLS